MTRLLSGGSSDGCEGPRADFGGIATSQPTGSGCSASRKPQPLATQRTRSVCTRSVRVRARLASSVASSVGRSVLDRQLQQRLVSFLVRVALSYAHTTAERRARADQTRKRR